jgi:hypothetical protein
MTNYDDDLLEAARRLIQRRSGQRGKLPAAQIRRSISTSYYAIFHFLLEECGIRLVGVHNDLRRRRRIPGRSFTHQGIKLALDKIRGPKVDDAVAEFMRWPNASPGPLPTPAFAQNMALAFSDAQSRRHEADYDLNKPLSATDAEFMRGKVMDAIAEWRDAKSVDDRDFKHSLCMLMLLKGQLRREG